MSSFLQGDLLYEGKTKRVWSCKQAPKYCILENKTSITAHDDPTLTKEFHSKAVSATATACRVFELLKLAGVPVAYGRQLTETSFVAERCWMIPLECIARREADGSYLRRFPNLVPNSPRRPRHRFHRLCTEVFLKTTGGRLSLPHVNGKTLLMPQDPLAMDKVKPIDDPWIQNPESCTGWMLCHPKIPPWGEGFAINIAVSHYEVLPENVRMNDIDTLTRKTFLILERAWGILGFKLIDFKIEFGMTADGELVVADVIDNDSWRLRDPLGNEVSKQLFRDGHPLAEVEEKYKLVAKLTEQFRIPQQAICLWKGAENDPFCDELHLPGIAIVHTVQSAHKSPEACLRQLAQLEANYPSGGVIVAIVGKSNGLAPMLAARTTWPVISVCATFKDRPHDVWSSLETPSDVPVLTLPHLDNAVLAAFNILSQHNPAAYAHCRSIIESRDP